MNDYLTKEELSQIFFNITRVEADIAVALLNRCRELGVTDTTKNENILPRPVIRDGNGKLTKDYSTREWFLKLQEEIFEAFEDSNDKYINHYEVADIITVCISYLNAIGYDEKMRSEIFRRVNEKNEKRGYFKESD